MALWGEPGATYDDRCMYILVLRCFEGSLIKWSEGLVFYKLMVRNSFKW